MNDIYQRLHLASEAQDQAEIIATLSAIKAGKLKNDLRLLNFYREVPVSYGAEVLTVEEHDAELAVNQIQAVVIAHEKLTVLKSSHFHRDVAAAVTYVNVEKSRVVVSNLSYALVRADRRMSVRVQLGSAIDASFAAPELDALHGRLHDMSLTGMSINVAREPNLPLSQAGELTIALPSGSITVAASLLKVIHTGDTFRMVFEIEPSRAAELIISQYIFQRQVEIIKELKDHPGVTL
ncbi:PilZ domain-containing protein [Geomonas subterranea]|uniref:PilZ domain-containing protein n=1 Tax=Geomonas subterranea TaxID=2847989 RepID=A0ABX8LII3_9BACT|nr:MULTISPECIES: PilZ domain-containing protein [Geomonas]QXE90159.1 PilZ domain-containing protein [Geomonas subterranea]QXM07715.1 PilZ domain-containing protein [Geomonas subterranea]